MIDGATTRRDDDPDARQAAIEEEEQWLHESVYDGDGTPGVRPVNPFHRFRS